MKDKSSYCVQDTSGISKMILKRGKYDLCAAAKITERGIGPLGISYALTLPACISGSGHLGPALLPFPNSPVRLLAFVQARGSKYLLTLFQNRSLGSFLQPRIPGHKGGRKKEAAASFCWEIQSTGLPKYQIFAVRFPIKQL